MSKRSNVPIYTGIAVAIILPLLIIYGINFINLGLSPNSKNLIGILGLWITVVLICIVVLKWEDRSLKTIGKLSVTRNELIYAILIGLGLSLLVPMINVLVQYITEEISVSTFDTSISIPIYIFAIITAGITEEIIYRGYLLERLEKLTGNIPMAIGISTTVFVLSHFSTWSILHTILIVAPLGVILSLIYIWKRNLVFNMIIHTMIDAPIIFILILN